MPSRAKSRTGHALITRFRSLALAALLLVWPGSIAAQEIVHFPSLADNGPGQPATMLDFYLFRPVGEGRHPAIVGLHDCSGMFRRNSTQLTALYTAPGPAR